MQDFQRYVDEGIGPFFKEESERGRIRLRQVPGHGLFPEKQSFFLEKQPGRRRVIVLGESSALLLAQALSRRVREEGLEGRVEVVNMAVGGSDQEQALRRFHEALSLSPDALVLLFGHNIFFQLPFRYCDPAWLRPILRRARQSRLLGLIRQRMSPLPPFKEPLRASSRLKSYSAALSLMAELSRRRAIPLMVCTVPGNLHAPPMIDSSLRAWKDFSLGERLYDAGRYEEAFRALSRAVDEDFRRWRVFGAVNETTRGIGREKGLVVLDFERMARRRAPHGIPGWESFSDAQHLWDFGWEADEILRRMGLPAPGRRAARAARNPLSPALGNVLAVFPVGDASSCAAVVSFARSYPQAGAREMEHAAIDRGEGPREAAILTACFAKALRCDGRAEEARGLDAQARLLDPAIDISRERWACGGPRRKPSP